MEEIDIQALQTLLQTQDTLTLVDVREPYEYAQGHIAQAVNIPMGDVGQYVDTLAQKDRVYFICRSGGRSAMVCRELEKRGVHGINIDGGMMMWEDAGLPVVTS